MEEGFQPAQVFQGAINRGTLITVRCYVGRDDRLPMLAPAIRTTLKEQLLASSASAMPKVQILDPTESYTFSRYAELPFDTADILAAFEVGLVSQALPLPEQLPIDPNPLRLELEENLTLVDPSSEIARREALIFPVLKTVCKFAHSPLKIEY